MKFKLIILMLITSITAASAQSPKRTNRFPVGTFHKKNQNINGLSVGLYSGYGDFGDSMRNVTISDSEEGFKTMMATPASERINGFNLSPAGTVCDCIVNGISAGLIGQINRQVSGVSASLVMNLVERHNGIQIAMFNESYAMNGLQIGLSNYGNRARGLQIGLFNQSKNFKGIQLGLWNRNQKRKLPILNWNFRD
jgi:hypothetical protein